MLNGSFTEPQARLREQPWNSDSVQIPFKILNDSLWAKLTCFPYIYYGGECGQFNLNCEHKPSYLIFDFAKGMKGEKLARLECVFVFVWRKQRAPSRLNERS